MCIFKNNILYYRIVASSFIAADVDQCNDALEEIFGQKHRFV